MLRIALARGREPGFKDLTLLDNACFRRDLEWLA